MVEIPVFSFSWLVCKKFFYHHFHVVPSLLQSFSVKTTYWRLCVCPCLQGNTSVCKNYIFHYSCFCKFWLLVKVTQSLFVHLCPSSLSNTPITSPPNFQILFFCHSFFLLYYPSYSFFVYFQSVNPSFIYLCVLLVLFLVVLFSVTLFTVGFIFLSLLTVAKISDLKTSFVVPSS